MPARAQFQALGLQQLRAVTPDRFGCYNGLNKEGRIW